MNSSDIDRLVGEKAKTVSLGDLLVRIKGTKRVKWLDLPKSPGIYAICLPDWHTRPFVADVGCARHAKPCDVAFLAGKRDQVLAVGPTDILYLGKAGAKSSTLRKRVRNLVHFGVGRAQNHRGGGWMWQLEGIDEAHIKMWCCPRGTPESLECKLLDRFKKEHGDLPLANRK